VSVRVTLCDVGPRDGLQNEPGVLAPAVRAELVNRLAAAGLPRVEAVSFVRDDLVPAMAGAEEVVAGIEPRSGTELAGLVLNARGHERLRATPLDRVSVSLGVTETFNRRNQNSSLEEAIAVVRGLLDSADRSVTVTLSVAFGDPWEGHVDPGRVVEVAERLADADELVLADTIGVATPGRVRALVERVAALGRPVGGHFHDTRNTGVANVWAALEGGATVFDASVGGLGGCPFAPGATGNVATEDVVYLLEEEGVETGVDLEALLAAGRWLEGVLGRALPGRLYRASPFWVATPASSSAFTSASE
jgi:isopropylmalate/homocitrate/citramalate synthase